MPKFCQRKNVIFSKNCNVRVLQISVHFWGGAVSSTYEAVGLRDVGVMSALIRRHLRVPKNLNFKREVKRWKRKEYDNFSIINLIQIC